MGAGPVPDRIATALPPELAGAPGLSVGERSIPDGTAINAGERTDRCEAVDHGKR